MYHEHRAYRGAIPDRGPSDKLWKVEHGGYSWQAQSYWLRVEWLTRNFYKDSLISHDPTIDKGIRFVSRPGSENLICDLYKAKCFNLNGDTRAKQIRHITAFNKVPTLALPVYLPDFYKSDWCDSNLHKLTTSLDLPPVKLDLAQRVHHRWCDLNHVLLETKN